MGTADAGRVDAATEGAPGPQLVRAAAVLRWTRPDLTATLAGLALEAAEDAEAWITAAGWLLHGRAAVGDGRETASELLDGLAHWGDDGLGHLADPVARRLRVELAGPARQLGEPAVARALLAGDTAGVDPDLRADACTELARCAVDDTPDAADGALHDAEQAWEAAGCAAGVASVMLLRAAYLRRVGRADLAVVQAAEGVNRVNAGGGRGAATASDHLAAALTAEWIAALVEAGRVDEARTTALPAADRLVSTARPSRQVAGLRLAMARVTAVGAAPDLVVAALEPAAQDAVDSDVPELESACRSMLGELHEGTGRLAAALAAVRAAMAADRRDRSRAARLRTRLAAAAGTWAGSPGIGPAARRGAAPTEVSGDTAGMAGARRVARTAPGGGVPEPAVLDPAVLDDGPVHDGVSVLDDGPVLDGPVLDGGPGSSGARAPGSPDARFDPTTVAGHGQEPGPGGKPLVDRAGTSGAGPASGRRARRLAAEALGGLSGPEAVVGRGGEPRGHDDGIGSRGGDGRGHRGDQHRGDQHRGGRRRAVDELSATSRLAPRADGANGVDVRSSTDGGSLIGDALARELAVNGRPADRSRATGWDAAVVGTTDGAPHTGTAGHDPLFGATAADTHEQPAADREPGDPDPWGEGDDRHTPVEDVGLDTHALRWNGASTWEGRPSSIGDTVVLGVAVGDHVAGRPPDAPRPDGRAGPRDGDPPAHDPPAHGPSLHHGADRSSDGRHHGHSPVGRARRSDGAGPYERDEDVHHPRHAGPGDTVRYDRLRDDAARYGGPPDGGPAGDQDADAGRLPGRGSSAGPGDRAGRHGPSGSPHANGHPGHGANAPGGTDGAGHGATADRGRSAPGTPGVSQTGRRPARQEAAGGPGRPSSTDTDGLGLADLLAGALAAYRNM